MPTMWDSLTANWPQAALFGAILLFFPLFFLAKVIFKPKPSEPLPDQGRMGQVHQLGTLGFFLCVMLMYGRADGIWLAASAGLMAVSAAAYLVGGFRRPAGMRAGSWVYLALVTVTIPGLMFLNWKAD